MNRSRPTQPESQFMLTNISLFLKRFSLSYYKEGTCIEYFLNRRQSDETISTALIFSYSPFRKNLHVSRFYPELRLQSNSKYLSAACFFLLIHHCAKAYALDRSCGISLETVPRVCEAFYTRLKDFNFSIKRCGLGDVVELVSDITPCSVNTDMITEHRLQPGEIPFMK